jgi:urease beta subunit
MKREKEPAAIRELHRIREEMLAEEKRVGSDKFWAEANRQGKEFARRHGLKYVESPAATAVRERPGKYKTKAR